MSPSERELTALLVNDPGEYERLLRSYYLLLGQRKVWWQRTALAERKEWPAAIRNAILRVANQSNVSARTLADWLDVAALPKTRARVLAMARDAVSRP